MNYKDKWGRYHDKPCNNGEPSSNNGWIYTAIARHLQFELDEYSLESCFSACIISHKPFKVIRSPDKHLPPTSHDEILGLVSLGMVTSEQLQSNYWNYCSFIDYKPKPLTPTTVWKAIKAAWKIRKGHRNDLWETPDLWPLGFRLHPHNTAYVRMFWLKRIDVFHFLWFYLMASLTVLSKKKNTGTLSGKNILWIKLRDLGMEDTWIYRKLNYKENIRLYFGPNHPFTGAVEKEDA